VIGINLQTDACFPIFMDRLIYIAEFISEKK
jgi:hypothetical protein